MKRKKDKRITRVAPLLLCCTMMFSSIQAVAFSDGVSADAGGLCAHHPAHTAACGYSEPTEGTPCAHEHSEECYTEIPSCIHEHTAECAPVGEAEAAEGAETSSKTAPDAADAANYGDSEPVGCTHASGEHDESCGYTAPTAESVCNFVCSLCPIQARIDALPGPEETGAVDEAARAEVQREISGLNEAIADKKVIDEGSATLKGYNWMIEKESDTHFILRIPGVTEGTPLPFDDGVASFMGIFGGVRFSAKVNGVNIFTGNGPTLNANQSSNIDDIKAAAVQNNGNVPEGTYDMEFKLSALGGTLNGPFSDLRKDDFVFKGDRDSFTLTVVLGTKPGNDVQFEPYRIQTVSPSNVNFTLFDYWVKGQTAHDHPSNGRNTPGVIPTCGNPACIDEHANVTTHATSFYGSGINKNHAIVFGPNGHRNDENEVLGDWNSPTGQNGGALSGIVAKQLNDDDYPVLDLDQGEVDGKSLVKNRNAQESLDYLFSLEESNSKAVYPNANGLLKIDPDTGNYMYSSLENFASYFEEDGAFKVYEKPAVKAGSSERGQFFPFNRPSQVFTIDDTGKLEEKQMKEFKEYEFLDGIHLPDGGVDAFFNHYFGLTMEVEFQQPPKGKISNAANAKDMVFEFTGDDDVWIFIDGVLVADLGGIHDTMSVEINFATGDIKIDRKDRFTSTNSTPTRVMSTITAQFEDAGVDTSTGFKGSTFADNTVHELKMFYIERGNFASNLELSFNLLEPRFSNIDKVDQKGDGLSGVEFKLYEAKENFEVPEGTNEIAALVTDEGGSVDLVTYDAAGKRTPIVFEPEKNYVLRESKTLDGFATTGDIHLRYNETINMLEVKNQWETGAVAGFETQITQTENLQFSSGGDASTEGQEGLILAVPLFNPINKGGNVEQGWRPLYGSVTEGFHMVEVETEDDEGYRKAALEAALRQLDNPANDHWYLEYNQEHMRFEGLLRDLPGSADRYVFVNPYDGDMLTAYYLLNPGDNTFDGCSTAEEKHNRLAEKLDGMTAEEQADYFEEQQENMKLLDLSQFNRQFYTRLHIPNQVRELRVHKQEEEGTPLAGAEFTLYSDKECTNAVAKGITDENGDMSFSAQNTGNNAVNGGELSSKVQFALTRDETADGRQARSYWLKETAAPDGYQLNTAETEIRITDGSLYANAGSADNRVSVRKGVGHLIQTMVRYAADDKLNVTLRDILATKYTHPAEVPGENLPAFDTWVAATDEEPLSLHYGLESALLDYGLHDTSRTPYFVADEGWLGFGVKQNYTAHQQPTDGSAGDEWSTAGGTKENIQDVDISALLTGTTTVVVTDKREPDTGSLRITKTVSGSGGDTSRKFTFTVALTDSSNAPVSGTYSYIGGSIGQVTAPASGSLTFDENGRASIELSHGQNITIAGLPVGTNYSVAENNYADYTVTIKGGAVGTIQKDTTAEAAFENHKDQGEDDVHVTVEKVWKLDDGGTAAASVTVNLLKNGKPYDTVVLNSGNGWAHTWTDLRDDCIWTVTEVDVPDGFAMSVEQSGDVFTIINDDVDPHNPPDPTDPPDSTDAADPTDPPDSTDAPDLTEPPDPTDPSDPDDPNNRTPQTGDDSNLLLWMVVLGISGLGMIATLILGKKKKYRPGHSK